MDLELWVSAVTGEMCAGSAITLTRDAQNIPIEIGGTATFVYTPLWLPVGARIKSIEYWHWRASGTYHFRCWRNDVSGGTRTQIGTTKTINSGTTKAGALDSNIDHVLLTGNNYVLEWENESGNNYFYGAKVIIDATGLPHARSVATIADLRAEPAVRDGEAAVVNGYTTAGDQGGGLFYFAAFGASPQSAKVTAATNATPIAITTAAAHGLNTGQRVMISGVTGNTAANGTRTIIVQYPMSAVTSAGTSPPTITLSGTAGVPTALRVECTLAGARGTWQFRYSVDNGDTWTTGVTSAATVALGSTGVTLNIAVGNASVDNVWTATTTSSSSTFTLVGSAGNGSYVTGGLIGNGGTTFPSLADGWVGIWHRIHDGEVNVRGFGAKGDGATDDATSIQAWLDYCCVSGVVGFIPSGNYRVETTLTIGGLLNPVFGPVFRGSKRTVEAGGAMIQWDGAQGATLLEIRNADGGTFENVGFHGGSLANLGVRMRHFLGDVASIRGWRFVGSYFGSALDYGVIIEGTGTNAYGDACGTTFDSCYFGGPQGGATPEAHVRITAQFTLGVTFLNPMFEAALVSSTYYPSYHVSVEAGSYNVYGGGGDPAGVAAFHMDGANGIPLGAFTINGFESQSAAKLVLTETAGTGATSSLRATVISGTYGIDIVETLTTEMITWDVGLYGTLVLDGCQVAGNVNVVDERALVHCAGAQILGNYAFTGHPERVTGFWTQNGSQRQRFRPTIDYQGIPSTPFAVGTESGNQIAVTITLSTTAKVLASVWLSDSSGGAPTGTAPNSGATINSGPTIATRTANVFWDALSDANGQIVLLVNETTAKSFWVNVSVPGSPLISQQITFA